MNTISNQIDYILTKQQLEKDYYELGSLTKIAKKYNLSDVPIKARFIKYGIPFKTKNQHNKCNHNIFSEESERAFYLAGFLAADGCIRISKTNKNSNYINHRIVIGLSIKDEIFLKSIQKILDSDHKLNYYIHKLSKYSDKWNNSESVKLSITSEQMVKDLKKFNIVPNKSLIYTFPDWLIDHPLKHHFIRGYVDGDGSFYFDSAKKSIIFSLRGTISFLENIKFIFEKDCKLITKTIPIISGGIGSFRINSKQLHNIVDFLYNDATLYLPRKYLIAKECLNPSYIVDNRFK
jgi:intein/homing endonuclease